MKLLILLLSLLFHPGTDTEIELNKEHTDTYRCDQYRPGVISEYLEVTLNSDRTQIKSIHYWYVYRTSSGAEESEEWNVQFRKGEQYDTGEEVGNEGELMLPETDAYVPFRIAEGVFEISHSADQIQIFEINN